MVGWQIESPLHGVRRNTDGICGRAALRPARYAVNLVALTRRPCLKDKGLTAAAPAAAGASEWPRTLPEPAASPAASAASATADADHAASAVPAIVMNRPGDLGDFHNAT